MAKKNKNQHKKGSSSSKRMPEEKITWEDVAAMSDSDDDVDTAGMELNTKAKHLKDAIAGGAFDGLLSKLQDGDGSEGDDGDDAFEEDVLGESSSEEEQDEGQGSDVEAQANDDSDGSMDDEEGDEQDGGSSASEEQESNGVDADYYRKAPASLKDLVEKAGREDAVHHSDEEEEDEENPKSEKYKRLEDNNNVNSKALGVVTAELAATHAKLPWAETFVIIPPTPLPFGENGDKEANPLDIHDDLKREVAFYNTALEAVHQARDACKKANVPFSRPDDFFAEMVKTDGT